MAIGLVFNGPGVTEAQYRQVLEQVSSDGQMAEGMVYHAAGPSEGGWCVIEIWESKEAADRFFHEKLRAALRDARIEIQPVFFEVINSMTAANN
jgi:hypothetical protein